MEIIYFFISILLDALVSVMCIMKLLLLRIWRLFCFLRCSAITRRFTAASFVFFGHFLPKSFCVRVQQKVIVLGRSVPYCRSEHGHAECSMQPEVLNDKRRGHQRDEDCNGVKQHVPLGMR